MFNGLGRTQVRIRTPTAGLLACAGLCCILEDAAAATYYVANAGDDANTGRSGGTAWRTLARAQQRAGSGDTVLLRPGDVFRETVQFGPGVTISGAGGPKDSPRPTVSGSAVITGWKSHKEKIYVAQTDKKIENLFVDDELMTVARFPNKSWLRTQEGTSADLIVDAELAKHPRNRDGYWKGANIRWRHWSWWFEIRPITSYDARGRLSLGGEAFRPYTGVGSGYFLDNKLEELDAPREWYFDPAEKKVYLHAPDGADPGELLVEGSHREAGMSIQGSRVEHVAFRHQTGIGLTVGGASAVVEDCLFKHIGNMALKGGSPKALIRRNVFEDNLNVGIRWHEWAETDGMTVIEENTLLRTGTVPAYCGSNSWHGAGIIITGKPVRIRYNYIDGTGYAGILPGAAGTIVEYNIILRAMSTLNDGGGIYTSCHRTIIRHNIILDTVGNLESSHPWYNLGHGIWLEFLGDYRESVVENNTSAGNGGYGLYLPNNFDCLVKGNVFFNNKRTQMSMRGIATNERTKRTRKLPTNHRIEDNVFCAGAAEQHTLLFRSGFDYGSMKGNIFCHPNKGEMVTQLGVGSSQWAKAQHTLAKFQQYAGWTDKEARSLVVRDASKAPGPGVPHLFINATKETTEIDVGRSAWCDLKGNSVREAVELEPYTSRILLYVGGRPKGISGYYTMVGGREKTVAKPKKPKKSKEPAKVVKRRVPKPGAIAENDSRLIARLSEELAAGRSPKMHVVAFQQRLNVLSIDEGNTLHLKMAGTEMTMEWSRLELSDRRSLALNLLREDNPDDRCLAAFYLLAEGNERAARDHLARSGGRTAEVEAFFALSGAAGAQSSPKGSAEGAAARGERPATEVTEGAEGERQREAEPLPSETSVASGRGGPRADPEIVKLYKGAETLFIEGDFEKARKMLERVLARDPGGEYGRKAKEFLELLE